MSRERTPHAAALLLHLADYLVRGPAKLRIGETIQHGSWLVQVQEGEEGRQRIGALRDDSGEYSKTLDQALIIEEAQRRQCELLETVFTPPNPQQLVVVDTAALSGELVVGVRYPAPAHMSGWWITSVDANARSDELQTLHVPHVITERADLLQLLALPAGWRFDTRDGYSAWFDEAVAAEPPE